MNKRAASGRKEWTVMFYLGSDNALSPLIVSQIKAIKDAGFQQDTNVLVYFDPQEPGVPTKIYDVNKERKEKALKRWDPNKWDANNPLTWNSLIGDGSDPFVHNMIGDELDEGEMPDNLKRNSRVPVKADESLQSFIEFALENHKAENYILILVGHGMIVANDAFLPDDDPPSGITLKQLREILGGFKKDRRGQLQLLALHSCSMSSIEVAYELKGTAKYMMATQGLSFLGSWPFRKLMIKILGTVESAKRRARAHAKENGADVAAQEKAAEKVRVRDIPRLIEKLYFLSLFNSTDFMTAGYSADVTLCNLGEEKLERIKESLQPLIKKLKSRVSNNVFRDLISLAHWESQSFYEENYSDLFDFCRCLQLRCLERANALDSLIKDAGRKKPGPVARKNLVSIKNLRDLSDACQKVMDTLTPKNSKERPDRIDAPVIHADNFGWKYQYARGLSIYFPWTRPLDIQATIDKVPGKKPGRARKVPQPQPDGEPTRDVKILANYNDYLFTQKLNSPSWLDFLEEYWEKTKRDARFKEDKKRGKKEFDGMGFGFLRDETTLEKFSEKAFNFDGTLAKGSPELEKGSPEVGKPCTCPSVKNVEAGVWRGKKVPFFFLTRGAARVFNSRDQQTPIWNPDDDDEDGNNAEAGAG